MRTKLNKIFDFSYITKKNIETIQNNGITFFMKFQYQTR